MITALALVLAALTPRRLVTLVRSLPAEPRRGRPWSCSHRRRVLITCVALRTNLTVRELAAAFAISKSAVHRIVASPAAGIARERDSPAGLPVVVGRRRNTDPNARPPLCRTIEELPSVLQRPDLGQALRSPNCRHRRWWPGQSQRSGALPRLDHRNVLPTAPTRPRRRWLPSYPRARHPEISRAPDPARHALASAPQAQSPCRACHLSAEELARPTGPSSSRPPPR